MQFNEALRLTLQEADERIVRTASQAQEECEAILGCADSPSPSAGGREDPAWAAAGPGRAAGHPEAAFPSAADQEINKRCRAEAAGAELHDHGWSTVDMDDQGGDMHGPFGPHYGRSAVWDGGGRLMFPDPLNRLRQDIAPDEFLSSRAVAGSNGALDQPTEGHEASGNEAEAQGQVRCADAQAGIVTGQYGVFDGISQESDDFDWDALNSIARPPRRQLAFQPSPAVTARPAPGEPSSTPARLEESAQQMTQPQHDIDRAGLHAEGNASAQPMFARHIPQVDGAYDDSSDDDAASQPPQASRLLGLGAQHTHTQLEQLSTDARSNTPGGSTAVPEQEERQQQLLPRASQRAACSGSQASSDRRGTIPLLRTSTSAASAPAALNTKTGADRTGAHPRATC